jgi:dihydrofolate reductase
MTIRAIMACDINGGVARNGTLPWPKSSEDFRIFKNYTMNQTVLMGSKTWFDPAFPKPMKERHTIVVTSKDKVEYADTIISGKPYEIINQIGTDFIVIGGADIFAQFYHYIQFLSLSVFAKDYDCDRYISVNDILCDFSVTRKQKYEDFTHYMFERKFI